MKTLVMYEYEKKSYFSCFFSLVSTKNTCDRFISKRNVTIQRFLLASANYRTIWTLCNRIFFHSLPAYFFFHFSLSLTPVVVQYKSRKVLLSLLDQLFVCSSDIIPSPIPFWYLILFLYAVPLISSRFLYSPSISFVLDPASSFLVFL